jgi:RNA-binding protein
MPNEIPMAKTSPPSLLPHQVRELRALAHDLKPVVRVGKNGYGPGLEQELEQALLAHELIKVKLEREASIDALELNSYAEAALGSAKIGVVGRTLILYRAHPKKPKIRLASKASTSSRP